MKYLLGSGYFGSKESPAAQFVPTWVSCLLQYANPLPSKGVILSVGNSEFPCWLPVCGGHRDILEPWMDIIHLGGNLGHVGQLLSGEKDNAFCGWSAAFITLAMMAYSAELDFIFLEQDCVAIGPWVQRMYADMGEADMVFGAKMQTSPYMASAQALVLVRHSFIPQMVAAYIELGDDTALCLPETKFARLEERWPERIERLSFGVDRERPIPYDDPVFYAQKLTEEELATLKDKKLI